jgi:multiple sugar transport system permease protein
MRRFFFSRRGPVTGLLFVLPAVIYMISFMAYPLFYNFSMSLRNLDVMTFKGNASVFIGLENYRWLFADPAFVQALLQTFQFTIWCLVFQFSLGLLMAVFFNGKFRLAGPARGLIMVSWMVPMSVTGLIFRYILRTEGGALNALLSVLKIIDAPIGWLIDGRYAMWGVIIANCWVGIPFNMLLLTTGMSAIPRDIYESASIDGANAAQRFFRITVPLLRPAIMSVLMLGFIYTFKVFDLIFMMTNGGPLNYTEVLATYSYRASFVQYNFSRGAAGAVVLFMCLMAVGIFYLRLIAKDEVM